MARTKEEIMEFLRDGKAVAEELVEISIYSASLIPWGLKKDQYTNEQLERNENYLKYDLGTIKEDARKFLEELDFDFQDAMIGASKDEQETINNEYQQRRKVIVDAIKTIDNMCDRSMERFNRFKQGEVITREEVCEDIEALKAQVVNGLTDKESAKNQPEQENEDLSADEAKTIAQKLKELEQAKAQRRKAQKAASLKKMKDFKKDIQDSGALYLKTNEKSKKLVEAYKSKIGYANEVWNERNEQLDCDEQLFETQLLEDREVLVEQKGELKYLREHPIIQKLEQAKKTRKRLEEQLQETTDDIEKQQLESEIKKVKAAEEKILMTDAGKAYIAKVNEIKGTKKKIANDKACIKRVNKEREDLDDWLDKYIQKEKETLKKNKSNLLPEKRSKFMMFIGGLRAKLGIGKHKADKNVADTLAKAIKEAENFTVEIGKVAVGSAVLVAQGIGKGVVAAKEGIDTAKEAVVNGIDNAKQSVVNGISNVKQSVSEHCTAQKAKIIAKLENHINKRIASEKQKTKDIMQKMNPDAGERE